VDSPVPVLFNTLTGITALGPVRYLVAATPRHVWRLAEWHQLFPEAELWVSRGTPFTLKKEPLPFPYFLGDVPPQAWDDTLDQVPLKGNPLIEETFFFHRKSRTVIVDDLIQNHVLLNGRPLRNALFKFVSVAHPHGGVPLDIRLSFIHRKLARRSLEKLFSWDFDKLIIAQGACIERNAKAFVERAFQWLI
jgi:hypothetical protein